MDATVESYSNTNISWSKMKLASLIFAMASLAATYSWNQISPQSQLELMEEVKVLREQGSWEPVALMDPFISNCVPATDCKH